MTLFNELIESGTSRLFSKNKISIQGMESKKIVYFLWLFVKNNEHDNLKMLRANKSLSLSSLWYDFLFSTDEENEMTLNLIASNEGHGAKPESCKNWSQQIKSSEII